VRCVKGRPSLAVASVLACNCACETSVERDGDGDDVGIEETGADVDAGVMGGCG
jgi:hypothetical protein